MEDLNLEQVQQFIEANKETEEVVNYLGQFSTVDATKVETFLGSDDGRSYKDKLNNSFLSSYTKDGGGQSRAFESMIKVEKEKWNKDNGLELSPLQIEVNEMKEELARERAGKMKSDLTSKAINSLEYKDLGSMAHMFVGKDEEETLKNVSTLNDFFKTFVDTEVEKRMKGESGREHIGGNGNPGSSELQTKVNAAKEKAMKSLKREDRVAWKVLSAQLEVEKGGK